MEKKKIIVICGPTATGKTALSVEMAHRIGGEIISTDSMQIYKGMTIGTAKITEEEMRGIPHYLVDFVDIDEDFNLAKYVTLAREKIDEIISRGKTPILVGGTGLYINTIINDVEFEKVENDYEYRDELKKFSEKYGNEALHQKLKEVDEENFNRLHPNDVTRVIRALEVFKVSGKTKGELDRLSQTKKSSYTPLMIALNYTDRAVLYERINKRVDIMMERGLLEEVREIHKMGYDRKKTALQAIGYKELLEYFDGNITLQKGIDDIKMESRRYAKRQLTWFRRDKRINFIMLNKQTTIDDIISQAMDIYNKWEGKN